ncbi:MAG: histidine--tRNA ligase [Pseudomonadota bacterium]|jgi:histidyl-tRNA synthetase|nr:histidine--tRNA ligase [Rhodospirillaceae bacterium]MEE2721680.1 histidine--tRNA ligase [Pseudomonadota bacterium]
MASLQPVRGTHDLLPDEARRARHVIETGRGIAERYGYEEAATPIFEFSEVFARTLGETSDIVTKEMYTFTDKGGEQITLRPEGTAGIARALISGGLSQHLPLKFFYAGPMFRYERPQKGRLRQFHQIGAELLGVGEPSGDVEVIALGATILEELGVLQHTALELNTLGNTESRAAYRALLVEYFSDHLDSLSAESNDRLERNPLRILDSKNEGDREIVAGAPEFDDSLDAASQEFFAAVCAGLDTLNIAWQRNSRLVRGLDYYCHTAFEFTTEALGAQGAVLAGGRYDGLVEQMGGPSTPGVGWASGIERLSMLIGEAPAKQRPISMIPMGDAAEAVGLRLTEDLRRAGYTVDMGYRGKMKQRMKRANNINASVAVILGDDELAQCSATLRDLDSGEQELVALDDLRDRLEQFR